MILRNLAIAGMYYGIAQFLSAARQHKKVVGRSLVSVSLFVGMIFFTYLASMFVLGAVFFALAEIDRFVQPALITAGIALLVALVLWLESKRLLTTRRYYEV